MPFWTRRRSCFLLCRSSVLGGVWLFRMRCRGAAFSASPGSAAPCFLSMYWGAFLLLRGFQRCRFGPAAGPFFLLCRSSVLSGVALFRMRCRGAAFSASPGSAAPCFLSMYWGSFLLLRWFQRCRFGSAECTVLCCAGARISVVLGCFACIAEELRFRLLQARLRHVFCLCTGALGLFSSS